ncbi:MAG: hypothetical protein CL711_02200 [Chloroflexi bacterium]|jgi:hypothetical protein|nr:MAG: hypothetical protein EGP09_02675 [SAR202 cluster bacterium]KAA1299078.1 MAG: hypothetical protein EGP06_02825 [SAR202 cluster bacterium]MAX12261.1 hypothetical protein [Chloroflexota bacterium]MQG12503.1 hypothetical protein [SAR202 cluster bacterium]|tara:strand:- start:13407 stop:14063 length:657 start_codon:yes stop_codon:yes gene_type:complete
MEKVKNKIPPYVSFKTFQTFLEFLSEGMPNRIDRSVWLNKFSGSNGTQIMTAIKFFNLIDKDGAPNDDFKNLVSRDLDLQKKIFRKLLYKYYSPIFNLDLTSATKAQLRESFRSFGTKEGVIVKCESFFIQAAKYSNIMLSSHILARRHNTNVSEKTKSKATKSQADFVLENNKKNLETNINLARMILDKYPDFDPNWNDDVKKSWIDSLTKLYESLK